MSEERIITAAVVTSGEKLEKIIENAHSINEIPSVKEKLNLLKEMVEDTDEQLIFWK